MKHLLLALLLVAGCVAPLPTKPVHLGMTWKEVTDARGYLYVGPEHVDEFGWSLSASEASGRASLYGSGQRGWHYCFERKVASDPYVLVSAYYVRR